MDVSDKSSEWWWVDYLEHEFEPGMEQNLKTLLLHSREDRDCFEGLAQLKQWIRESDPAAGVTKGGRLEAIRRNVMEVIEQTPLVLPQV